jgi:hypothetical protein
VHHAGVVNFAVPSVAQVRKPASSAIAQNQISFLVLASATTFLRTTGEPFQRDIREAGEVRGISKRPFDNAH